MEKKKHNHLFCPNIKTNNDHKRRLSKPHTPVHDPNRKVEKSDRKPNIYERRKRKYEESETESGKTAGTSTRAQDKRKIPKLSLKENETKEPPPQRDKNVPVKPDQILVLRPSEIDNFSESKESSETKVFSGSSTTVCSSTAWEDLGNTSSDQSIHKRLARTDNYTNVAHFLNEKTSSKTDIKELLTYVQRDKVARSKSRDREQSCVVRQSSPSLGNLSETTVARRGRKRKQTDTELQILSSDHNGILQINLGEQPIPFFYTHPIGSNILKIIYRKQREGEDSVKENFISLNTISNTLHRNSLSEHNKIVSDTNNSPVVLADNIQRFSSCKSSTSDGFYGMVFSQNSLGDKRGTYDEMLKANKNTNMSSNSVEEFQKELSQKLYMSEDPEHNSYFDIGATSPITVMPAVTTRTVKPGRKYHFNLNTSRGSINPRENGISPQDETTSSPTNEPQGTQENEGNNNLVGGEMGVDQQNTNENKEEASAPLQPEEEQTPKETEAPSENEQKEPEKEPDNSAETPKPQDTAAEKEEEAKETEAPSENEQKEPEKKPDDSAKTPELQDTAAEKEEEAPQKFSKDRKDSSKKSQPRDDTECTCLEIKQPIECTCPDTTKQGQASKDAEETPKPQAKEESERAPQAERQPKLVVTEDDGRKSETGSQKTPADVQEKEDEKEPVESKETNDKETEAEKTEEETLSNARSDQSEKFLGETKLSSPVESTEAAQVEKDNEPTELTEKKEDMPEEKEEVKDESSPSPEQPEEKEEKPVKKEETPVENGEKVEEKDEKPAEEEEKVQEKEEKPTQKEEKQDEEPPPEPEKTSSPSPSKEGKEKEAERKPGEDKEEVVETAPAQEEKLSTPVDKERKDSFIPCNCAEDGEDNASCTCEPEEEENAKKVTDKGKKSPDETTKKASDEREKSTEEDMKKASDERKKSAEEDKKKASEGKESPRAGSTDERSPKESTDAAQKPPESEEEGPEKNEDKNAPETSTENELEAKYSIETLVERMKVLKKRLSATISELQQINLGEMTAEEIREKMKEQQDLCRRISLLNKSIERLSKKKNSTVVQTALFIQNLERISETKYSDTPQCSDFFKYEKSSKRMNYKKSKDVNKPCNEKKGSKKKEDRKREKHGVFHAKKEIKSRTFNESSSRDSISSNSSTTRKNMTKNNRIVYVINTEKRKSKESVPNKKDKGLKTNKKSNRAFKRMSESEESISGNIKRTSGTSFSSKTSRPSILKEKTALTHSKQHNNEEFFDEEYVINVEETDSLEENNDFMVESLHTSACSFFSDYANEEEPKETIKKEKVTQNNESFHATSKGTKKEIIISPDLERYGQKVPQVKKMKPETSGEETTDTTSEYENFPPPYQKGFVYVHAESKKKGSDSGSSKSVILSPIMIHQAAKSHVEEKKEKKGGTVVTTVQQNCDTTQQELTPPYKVSLTDVLVAKINEGLSSDHRIKQIEDGFSLTVKIVDDRNGVESSSDHSAGEDEVAIVLHLIEDGIRRKTRGSKAIDQQSSQKDEDAQKVGEESGGGSPEQVPKDTTPEEEAVQEPEKKKGSVTSGEKGKTQEQRGSKVKEIDSEGKKQDIEELEEKQQTEDNAISPGEERTKKPRCELCSNPSCASKHSKIAHDEQVEEYKPEAENKIEETDNYEQKEEQADDKKYDDQAEYEKSRDAKVASEETESIKSKSSKEKEEREAIEEKPPQTKSRSKESAGNASKRSSDSKKSCKCKYGATKVKCPNPDCPLKKEQKNSPKTQRSSFEAGKARKTGSKQSQDSEVKRLSRSRSSKDEKRGSFNSKEQKRSSTTSQKKRESKDKGSEKRGSGRDKEIENEGATEKRQSSHTTSPSRDKDKPASSKSGKSPRIGVLATDDSKENERDIIIVGRKSSSEEKAIAEAVGAGRLHRHRDDEDPIKVVWALTKVNIYESGSRTFEVLEASTIPPGRYLVQEKRNSKSGQPALEWKY